jgi:hypothetical protein
MTPIHERIAEGRWQRLSLPEQLGNVGSEVSRAISWTGRGNELQADRAFDRALDLLDLTLADGRWTGRRRREIARAREVLCADYLARDEAALRSLDRYFTAFALLARRDR